MLCRPLKRIQPCPKRHAVDTIAGVLLAAIKLLYKRSKVCVCVNGMKTKPFSVSVGL